VKIIGGAKIFQNQAEYLCSRRVFAVDPKLTGLFKQLIEEQIAVPERMENFIRDGIKARLAQLLAVMTVDDAQIGDTGAGAIILWNGSSCITENRNYFADYLQYNRESGQGKFFVATLPSTPAAAAAIAVKLHGAVYYYAGSDFDDLINEISLNAVSHPFVIAMEISDTHAVAVAFTSGTGFVPASSLNDIF
jgi:hypothetical protein